MARLKRKFEPDEILNYIFLSLLSVFQFIHSSQIKGWYLFISVNFIICILIYFIIGIFAKKKANNSQIKKSSVISILRFWYGIPVVLYCFKQVYHIIQGMNLPLIDLTLIKIDYSLFGVNPTEWMMNFANPFVTEVLQVIYFYYYLLFIFFFLEFYLKRNSDEYKFSMFLIFIGFYISYIFYLIFPAAGPRFFIHDFFSISKELSGILLTEPSRIFLNFGESIPAGVSNPILHVQKDAMPSAHVSMAFLVLYLSWKFKTKSVWFYLPYFVLMAVSTIYLRYHYVVDVLAGVIVGLLAIFLTKLFYSYKSERD